MSIFKNTIAFAKEMDAKDPLKEFRDLFHLPTGQSKAPLLYFCGNSLGLQPKQTKNYIKQELDDWAQLGVEGHIMATNPWLNYHEILAQPMAKIVGAKPSEVVVMNTLTANLHFMMVSFYKPTSKRHKILIESDAFPSDKYAVESQLKHHGYDPKDDLILWKPKKNKECLDLDDLNQILEKQGNEIALLLIGGVNYYTGQFLNLKQITNLGHKYGCLVGFDCAHGAGNVALNLHDSGADFATWCSYKYLNSGPGSLSGCFVHERHGNNPNLNRFSGWWNHDKASRFNMRQEFKVLEGAEGWQLSNPPILSMAAIKASLDIFESASMNKLIEKSKLLTAYLEYLLKDLDNKSIRIITPTNPKERGCQLSIQVINADKKLHNALTDHGIITDWREPDVIRCAPVPLYNSFEDVFKMVEQLNEILTDYDI